MSLTLTDLQNIFNKHVPKEQLSVLSFDSIEGYSVINSDYEWYDFDKSEGHQSLMTIDSANFIGSKLIFAEFKNEQIKSKEKFKFLRLKANESLLSLLLLCKKEIATIQLSELNSIDKECYFVFSKTKTSPTQLLSFNATHRNLKRFYERTFFKKFDFINCEQFKEKFLEDAV